MLGELNELVAIDINDQRLEDPTFTTIYCPDGPASRCRVLHTRYLFIEEQQITSFDPVAFANLHRRLHSDVVGANNSDRPDRLPVGNLLLRIAFNRKIQPFGDSSHQVLAVVR